jgi:hypothetical protein
MLITVTLASFAVRSLHLPRELLLVPEGLSLIALLIVVIRLPRNRLSEIEPRYLLLFLLLMLQFIAGVLVNHLQPGVIISGARIYLKAVPFFVLPLLFTQTEKNLKWQFLLLAGVCLMQLPIAWDQRMSGLFRGSLTGDRTVGTMGISSNLSVFLCCASSVALALYLKGKLRIQWLVAFLALTLPATMINETKATIFIAPFALLIPALFGGKTGQSSMVKRVFLGGFLVAGFLAAFIPVYDHFIKERWGYGLMDFFAQKGRVAGYLDKGAGLGAEHVGRVDSLTLPFMAAKHDFTQAFFGLGAGNVSQSSLGPSFTGEQFPRFGNLVGPTASRLIWELGLGGLAIALVLFWMIFRDAFVARHAEGITRALGLGWIAVTAVMGLTMFYNVAIQNDALTYLYFFYSGVVVAAATNLRQEAAQRLEAERARAKRRATFGAPAAPTPASLHPVARVRPRPARVP